MACRILTLSANVPFLIRATTFQRISRYSLSRYFAGSPISQVFKKKLSDSQCASVSSPRRTIKLANPNSGTAALTNRDVQSALGSHKGRLMSFSEYKKKHLLTFDQYKEKLSRFVKSDEKRSAESKLEESYELYTDVSYRNYKNSFLPPLNPLIV